MKKTTKWILGILLTLVILAVLAAVAFLVFNHGFGGGGMAFSRPFHSWDDGRTLPWRSMHPGSGLPFGRMGFFSPLRFLVGGLINIGLLTLIVLGVVYLLRGGLNRPAIQAAPAAAAAPATMAAPAITAAPAPAQVCPGCAHPLQADWKHCPYCGRDLAGQP